MKKAMVPLVLCAVLTGSTLACDTYLCLYPEFPVGETEVEVIPPCFWPAGTGCATGLYWYGALLDPQMTMLVGEFDMWEFGFGAFSSQDAESAPAAFPKLLPTPAPCINTGVTLLMPSNYFYPGDEVWCRALVCNSGTEPLVGYPLMVLLDIYGTYFFAPSFITATACGPPVLDNLSPAPGAGNVPVNTNITLDLYRYEDDPACGIAVNSITMSVNQQPVTAQVQPVPGGVSLIYDPPQDFADGETVVVTVRACSMDASMMAGTDSPMETATGLSTSSIGARHIISACSACMDVFTYSFSVSINSNTPTPTPTPTPVTTATPTPAAGNHCNVGLLLNRTFFVPEDLFLLSVQLTPAITPLNDLFFTVLDVWGAYFFYPAWSDQMGYEPLDWPDQALPATLLNFIWPLGAGNASGLKFYAAVLDGDFNLVSNLAMVEFGFGE
ncbi:hypothetical protein JW905_07895 [bacterium]|nr:hypothetical protein [candidate division CSSED10-310 bacterium]